MSKAHEVTAWIDLNIIDKSWGKSLTKDFDDKKAKYLIESMPVPNTITWLVYPQCFICSRIIQTLPVGQYQMLLIISMKNSSVNYYL
jgi:hypothetical protein